MSLILTNAGLSRFLANAFTDGDPTENPGWLNATRAILFVNNPPLNRNTVLTDLEQPDVEGIGPTATAFVPTAYQSADGTWFCVGGLLQFQPSEVPDPVPTIMGWALLNPAAETEDILLAAELLPAPVALTGLASSIQFIPRLQLPPLAVFGGAVFLAT